jgi:hypothetical protein
MEYWFEDLNSNVFISLRIFTLINQLSWTLIVLLFHYNITVVTIGYTFALIPSLLLLVLENSSYYYSRYYKQVDYLYNLNTLQWTFLRCLFFFFILGFLLIWLLHKEPVLLIVNWVFMFVFLVVETIYSYLKCGLPTYQYETI